MICPNCKKEGTFEQLEDDPQLYGCTNCHSGYSHTYLLGYMQGWIDRKQSLLAALKKKNPTAAWYDQVYFKGLEWLDNL